MPSQALPKEDLASEPCWCRTLTQLIAFWNRHILQYKKWRVKSIWRKIVSMINLWQANWFSWVYSFTTSHTHTHAMWCRSSGKKQNKKSLWLVNIHISLSVFFLIWEEVNVGRYKTFPLKNEELLNMGVNLMCKVTLLRLDITFSRCSWEIMALRPIIQWRHWFCL